jgi:hypothetical protein
MRRKVGFGPPAWRAGPGYSGKLVLIADGGDVCKTLVMTEPKTVKVMVDDQEMSVNFWD